VSHYVDDWAGTHDFKFGIAYEWSYAKNTSAFGVSPLTGDHIYYLSSDYYEYYGYPGGLYYAYIREPYLARSVNRVTSIYADDSWTIGDRLSLNLGLRYDHSTGTSEHDGESVEQENFNTFAPRLGFSFDLTGDGKTELRAFYGRYYDSIFGSTYTAFDFGQTPKFAAFVTGPGEYEITRVVSDPLGTATGTPVIGIDPDLDNQYADEFDVGIERVLWPNASISVTYVHKEERNLFGGNNILARYEPTSVQDPGPDGVVGTGDDGAVIPAFHRTNLGENLTILENREGVYRDYNGLDIIFTKRWSDNWNLLASLVFQEAKGTAQTDFSANSFGGSQLTRYDSPNDFIFLDGTLRDSRPYIFKLSGAYRIPDPIGLLISAHAESFKGGTTTRDFSIRSAAGESQRIFAEERGSTRLPTVSRLNLRLEKQFNIPGSFWNGKSGGTLGISADFFNLFNDDTPISIIAGSGPTFGDAIELVPSRQIRFGVRYLW
jgi:hypothetical protein